jgi:hypothetical protein
MAADRNVVRAKLTGLAVLLDDVLKNDRPLFSVFETRDLFDRVNSFFDSLRTDYAELFADLPRHVFFGDRAVHRSSLEALRRDVSYALTVLEASEGSERQMLQVGSEGIFFSGEVFDALRHIDGLIRRAKKKLVIVDGYINERVLDLLTAKGQGVEVELMTKKSQVTPAFKAHVEAFNAQHGGLTVRTNDEFHDRFVILDGAEFYHFGASLKDAGRKGFMFSRLEEPSLIESLRNRLNVVWGRAAPLT